MLLLLLSCIPSCREPTGTGPGFADYLEECLVQDDCMAGLVCGGDGLCHYPGEPGTAAAGDLVDNDLLALPEILLDSLVAPTAGASTRPRSAPRPRPPG